MTRDSTPIVLRCNGPFDWAEMLRFYELRALPGIEQVEDGCYRRTVRYNGEAGILQVSYEHDSLHARLWIESQEEPDNAIVRLRQMFDLDADVDVISSHLSQDPRMAAIVARRPCLRIPGGWDPFEIALRAVLGQQVSIGAARVLGARLVERCGEDLIATSLPGLSRIFPTPAAVVTSDLSNMGMPGARADTLKAVAEAFLQNPLLFHKGASAEETVARLRKIKGIGEWTAQYIALRACRELDAFPAGDAGILRGLADDQGVRPNQKDVLVRAEAWRPYRAYAAHYIWALDERNLMVQESV